MPKRGSKIAPRVVHTCAGCNKIFEKIYRKQDENTKNFYCSKLCRQGNKIRNTNVPSGTKECFRCNQVFPETNEYFTWGKLKGFSPYCKPCQTIRAREWREENRERVNERGRKYRNANKEKFQARYKAYSQTEHFKEFRREYEQRPEIKARRKRYTQANPEKAKVRKQRYRTSEKGKQTEKSYRNTYSQTIGRKIASRLYTHKRRAALKGTGVVTVAFIQDQNKRQKNCCYYCGIKMGKSYNIEHIIPVTRGGTNDPSNLVLVCRPCNQSKKNKLPHEWPNGGRLL